MRYGIAHKSYLAYRMSMIEKDGVILKCWHNVVVFKKHKLLLLSLNNDRFKFTPYQGDQKPCGFYAAYHEGIFAFFATRDGKLQIGWKDQLVDISEISKTVWSSKVSGRSLQALGENGQHLIKAKYHTLKRFLLNPLGLLLEFLMPDDDWGLEADLPSFIDTYVRSGKRAELGPVLQQLLARE
jgi:hypothetical protein